MKERVIVEGVALAVRAAGDTFMGMVTEQLDEVPLEKRAEAAAALREGRYEVRVAALPDGVTLTAGVTVDKADAHFPVALAVGFELMGASAFGLTADRLRALLKECPPDSVVIPAVDGTLRAYEPGGARCVAIISTGERGYEYRAVEAAEEGGGR